VDKKGKACTFRRETLDAVSPRHRKLWNHSAPLSKCAICTFHFQPEAMFVVFSRTNLGQPNGGKHRVRTSR